MKTNQNNEKTVPTQEQIEAACRQSARHFWNWLTWSLVYYVVINLFLIAINWFTSPHYWWGTMGDSRLGNQLADDSHRKKHQILINHKLKRKNSMEERKLNEKESLELIAQMIQNTKNRLETNCGMPFLFWGYTTLFVSLLVWFLVVTTGNYYWQDLWFLLPIIAGTGTYLSTRNQQPGIKTHLDKVINYIWLVFGITGFLISMLAMFFWQLPILFIILLLMGMGTTLTGLVVGYKTVTICGTLGALSSIGCLFYPGPNQILIFAPVFIFMMVIPGHVLNHAARKQKKS